MASKRLGSCLLLQMIFGLLSLLYSVSGIQVKSKFFSRLQLNNMDLKDSRSVFILSGAIPDAPVDSHYHTQIRMSCQPFDLNNILPAGLVTHGHGSTFNKYRSECARTLDALETRLEDKSGFLRFIQRSLTWMPEKRATAK